MARLTRPDREFTFEIIEKIGKLPNKGWNQGFLSLDRWDDWGKYRTQFILNVFDEEGTQHTLGYVKIGEFGLKPGSEATEGQRAPNLPKKFTQIGDQFFTLGQEAEYYEVLGRLSSQIREAITNGLRDVVANRDLWLSALDEDVTKVSLLRSISSSSVKSVFGQFRRLLEGGAKLTPYGFQYCYPLTNDSRGRPDKFSFHVEPESFPPTNIHVLIGGNGVGKTYTLNLMAKALAAGGPHRNSDYGQFVSEQNEIDEEIFANVVSVSFSAFDNFDIFDNDWEKKEGMKHTYIGLKEYDGPPKRASKPKTPQQLTRELQRSVDQCLDGTRIDRWKRALRTLESDPVFHDARIAETYANENERSLDSSNLSDERFQNLSSGHKIVLLTIARLIETVEEKTLVLIDEPESHLHPPLLSAFIRALCDLLINRNGVAIIATHSPVVLQEVPKNCVWKIRRIGSQSTIERPERETFGENIGVLTREVFRLEVTNSGFHQMLKDVASRTYSYDRALKEFGEQLGGEARALLRVIFLCKEDREEDF